MFIVALKLRTITVCELFNNTHLDFLDAAYRRWRCFLRRLWLYIGSFAKTDKLAVSTCVFISVIGLVCDV